MKKFIISSLLLAIVCAGADQKTTTPTADGPFKPELESFKRYECPVWFRDAKFGIWSHWGPASIPGFNNYARDMWRPGSGEYKWHLEHFGHHSKFGYKEVIESWKAEKFDPEALVAKYKAAGAKYFVALATHHDNFDCFDSTHHEWNSVKKGPEKDIVALWRDAALKAGMRFGVSSHADERGWNYMYGARLSDPSGKYAGVPYQGADPAYASLYNSPQNAKDKPPEVWKEKWLLRHLDLVDKYRPDLLYFDGGIPHGQYGMKLISHYLNANAKDHDGTHEAVVNVKGGSFVHDTERGVPLTTKEKPWQNDTSLSGWFYMNHNPNVDPASLVKDAPTIIHTLADVVSKNGNLLLNFPQRGDGSLYPECEQVLDELAKWMPVNGEAIYDTRPWTTFGEGPTKFEPKSWLNELRNPMTLQDIRFTRSKDGRTLYAIVCGVPSEPVRIKSLAKTGIAAVSLLGSNAKLDWKQESDALVIQPVAKWPSNHAVTFKIALTK